jgi:hypothetical protein
MEEMRTWRPALGEEPLVSADDRAKLPALIAAHEAQLVPGDPRKIPAIIGYLSTAFPAKDRTEGEDRARLRHYVDGLNDYPTDVLEDACRQSVRRHKFMPTVAEIREIADGLMARRRWPMWVLKRLADRFDRETPAEKLMPPEEAKASLAKLSKRLAAKLATTG